MVFDCIPLILWHLTVREDGLATLLHSRQVEEHSEDPGHTAGTWMTNMKMYVMWPQKCQTANQVKVASLHNLNVHPGLCAHVEHRSAECRTAQKPKGFSEFQPSAFNFTNDVILRHVTFQDI
jgi:hypothetical protein